MLVKGLLDTFVKHNIKLKLQSVTGSQGVIPYISQMPLRVGFALRFGLKTGIDFAHFGLESDMVYEGTTVVCQCVRRFNSKCIIKKV